MLVNTFVHQFIQVRTRILSKICLNSGVEGWVDGADFRDNMFSKFWFRITDVNLSVIVFRSISWFLVKNGLALMYCNVAFESFFTQRIPERGFRRSELVIPGEPWGTAIATVGCFFGRFKFASAMAAEDSRIVRIWSAQLWNLQASQLQWDVSWPFSHLSKH